MERRLENQRGQDLPSINFSLCASLFSRGVYGREEVGPPFYFATITPLDIGNFRRGS